MTLPLVIDAEAVVLDLDGLLIDSETACFETANEILSEFGHRLASDDFASFVGRSVDEFYGSWYLSGVLDRWWFTRPGGLRCAT